MTTGASATDSPKPTSTPSITNTPTTSNSPTTTNDASAPTPSKPKSVAYQPGITLNYEMMRVEIEAKVVLRVGELELLAWSIAPTPKEHETILAMRAKPSAIYEALGLIGLTPGSPPHYQWESKTFHPATGDLVDVLVAYEHNGTRAEHSICDWAIDKDRDAPMEKRSWVFAGSHKMENGAFAADIEGTVVTVVDFPSSLLSLADSHSDSNDALWLVANTDAIPDTGTTVTLILQAAR